MISENFTTNKENIDQLLTEFWAKKFTTQKIADIFNANKYQTKKGLPWSKDNVSFYARTELNLQGRNKRPTGIKNKPKVKVAPEPAYLTAIVEENNNVPNISYTGTISPETFEKTMNQLIDDNQSVEIILDETNTDTADTILKYNFNIPEEEETEPENIADKEPEEIEPETLSISEYNDISLNRHLEEAEIKNIEVYEHNLEIKDISFYDGTLTAIRDKNNNQEYFIPSKICDILGLQWSGQRQRILRDEDLYPTMCKLNIVTRDRRVRPVIALPLRKLSIFLYGIKTSMVKEEIKANIIKFKTDMEDILLKAFTNNSPLPDLPKKNSLEILKDVISHLIEVDKKTDKALQLAQETTITVKQLEQKTNQISVNFKYLDEQRLEALKNLQSLRQADPDIIEFNARPLVLQHLRSYLYATGQLNENMPQPDKEIIFRASWEKIKTNFKYVKLDGKCHDFARVAENESLKQNKKVRFLDVVEQAGYMEHLLAFVQRYFKIPLPK